MTTTQNDKQGANVGVELCNFQASRAEISGALARLIAVIGGKPRRSILENILVEVNGVVNLTAHNKALEFSATESIKATGKQGEFAAVVNAKAFKKAISASKNSVVSVSIIQRPKPAAEGDNDQEQEFIRCVCVNGFELTTANVDEFPTVDHVDIGSNCRGSWFGSVVALSDMIALTTFACDSESSRYALSGVLIELSRTGTTGSNSLLTMVGTDGRRLSVVSTGSANLKTTGILSGKNLNKASKALKNKQAVFAVLQLVGTSDSDHGDGSAQPLQAQLFTFDAERNVISMYTFRLTEGRFPNWRDVIPQADHVGNFDGQEFLELSNQAHAATIEQARGVDFKAVSASEQPNDNDTLTASTQNESGNFEKSIDVEFVAPRFDTDENDERKPAPYNVCLNGGYLVDWLGALPAPKATGERLGVVGKPSVDWRGIDESSAAMLSAAFEVKTRKAPDFAATLEARYIVMPLSK